ncbi:AAA family ATPase [uncultured Brachybacterium sp.]|uniref:MinD/ParA family ATP-binding protein n=1 Tax=uncultured Brachybacterium sp. TaxID=189680 RepID=UPI002629A3AD|nr:AAA family ATPase [uncultured Brachybacterium sp.]
MTDAQITINHDGTGSVTVDGGTTTIAASGAAEARREAIARIAKRAAELGRPLPATAAENGRSWPLLIAPDGTVSPRTLETVIEAQEPQEDLDVTRPRAASSISAPAAPAMPPAVPEQPRSAPDAEPSTPASSVPEQHGDSDQAPTFATAHATPSPEITDPIEADPRWAETAQQPATLGIRGSLNKMGLTLTPGAAELEQRRAALREQIALEEKERLAAEERARTEATQESRRAAREREAAAKDKAQRVIIQTTYGEPKTIAFMNEKGGVGKTTDTYCIGATMGRIRGGDVIAWDANETRGTLGFRAQKDSHTRSVVDLLEEAADDFTTVQGSKRATLTRYTRGQGDNLFGVIASDQSRDRQDLVDGDAFVQVHEILSRFYSLILIDTGNNHRVSHFTSALEATDQLVIPVSAGADGAYAAEVMLDNFTSLGHAELVKNAVVLLHDSATRRGDAGAIAQRFEDRVRAIIPIPFDSALDTGDEIDYDVLAPATRAAYQEAAAAISEGLASTTKE